MKLINRIAWGRRGVVELRGIRRALERIADSLDAAIAPDIEARAAFRSSYEGDDIEGADISYTDDDDRRAMEEQELADLRRGGPTVPGFYDGEDDRVGSIVGPTVQEQVEREQGRGPEEGGA